MKTMEDLTVFADANSLAGIWRIEGIGVEELNATAFIGTNLHMIGIVGYQESSTGELEHIIKTTQVVDDPTWLDLWKTAGNIITEKSHHIVIEKFTLIGNEIELFLGS
jgi:hypothetical protein